jgi:hypothetical protein
VIRDAINAGDIPGPRYLANGKEMARRDGERMCIPLFPSPDLNVPQVVLYFNP